MNEGAELVPIADRRPAHRPADGEISAAASAEITKSIPDSTRRAYTRWITDFADWCESHDRTSFPATAETLVEYVVWLKHLGKGVPSMRQAIAAIRSEHAIRGYPGEPNAYLARLVARGHAREQASMGVRSKQAPPLLRDDIEAMLAVSDPNTLRGSRDRLILAVGWTVLLRRSELAALHYPDVRPCANPDDGIDVFIAASKTDQEARGAIRTAPHGEYINTPPMLIDYRRARLAAGLDSDGPLFVSIEVGGRIGRSITGDAINDLVKDTARRAGLRNPDDYSAHSLRAGGATGMYLAGCTIDEIIERGRWAAGSTVVMGYIRAVDRTRRNSMTGVV